MSSKTSRDTRRCWRPGQGFFLCAVLAMVGLPNPGWAQPEEPKSDLVLVMVTALPAETGTLWALCLRQVLENKPTGVCYSPFTAAAAVSTDKADESAVTFTESWTSWLEKAIGEPPASSARPAKQIETFELPPQIKKSWDPQLFRQQTAILVENAPEDALRDMSEGTSQLFTAEQLRQRKKRKFDLPSLLKYLLDWSRQPDFDSAATSTHHLTWMVIMFGLGLLPTVATLTLIRIRTGVIPTTADFHDVVKHKKLLVACKNKLDMWMNEAGEKPRKKTSMEPLLDNLELALERLQGLHKALQRLLGYEVGLASLHTDLAGRIGKLDESGKPATLQGLFHEVRDLRRLRNQMETFEARATPNDQEDLQTWIDRIATRLEQTRKVAGDLSELGAGSPTDVLAHLKQLCASARKVDPKGSPTLEELAHTLESCLIELGQLARTAGVDPEQPAAVQLREILKKYNEIKTQEEQSKNAANTCKQEVAQLNKHIASIGHEFFPAGEDGSSEQWLELLRNQLHSGHTLAEKLQTIESVGRAYLGLDPDGEFAELLRRESQQPHRALRLRLLGALEPQAPRPSSALEQDIIEVLRLNGIWEKASLFLKRLSAYPDGPSLWSKGLAPAFGDQWLHDLLRAALVLDTYYRDSDIRKRFGWVWALSEAFQENISILGKHLAKVQLLAPPAPSFIQLRETSTLIRLHEVRRQVGERKNAGTRFVVDVTRFALPGNPHYEECHVILHNPADWDPSQEKRK